MIRRALVPGILAAVVALAVAAAPAALRPMAEVPAALSDAEFWRLIGDLSEPEGFFDSDNLVSNEDTFQRVIPELARTVTKGGVYLGVGPDQNFAYILAAEPAIAFITDIRRGNLRVHLMYKALIELSSNRADFLSRLFSRPRPAGLSASASADDLFRAFHGVAASAALFDRNLDAILGRLQRVHGFALEAEDRPAIETIYRQFYRGGPDLQFVSSRGGTWYPSYEDIQVSTDGAAVNHGYLASEAGFARLKAMEEANLIVPVVGNFAGPHALRAEGDWARAHGARVTVFYASNVERYLFQDATWRSFVSNVAMLPLDEHSLFIRSCFDSCASAVGARAVSLLDSIPALLTDVRTGRITTYYDVLRHSHGN
jgi:hypothetical protein